MSRLSVGGKGCCRRVGGQLGKTAEGALAQVMLDALDVGKMIAVIEPHQLKEIGQHGVTLADFFRHAAALRRQREAAVGLVAKEPELAEPLDHDRRAGAVQAQRLGHVGDAGVALGAFQIENAFEVILHALGHPGAIMGAAFAGGVRLARTGVFRAVLGMPKIYWSPEHV